MNDTAGKRWRRALAAWLASPIRPVDPPAPPGTEYEREILSLFSVPIAVQIFMHRRGR